MGVVGYQQLLKGKYPTTCSSKVIDEDMRPDRGNEEK
jgi:hypothetical protein